MNLGASTRTDLFEGRDFLLAKSLSDGIPPRSHEQLQGHTRHVLDAARTLLDLLTNAVLDQLGLDSEDWGERLRRAVLMGAWFHDAGKCNDHFQTMIRSQRLEQQSIRHEALSGILFARFPQLREWVCPANSEAELIFKAALSAAVGHHLKTDRPSARTSDDTLTAYVSHQDFKEYLLLGAERLALDYSKLEKFTAPITFNLLTQKDDAFPSLKKYEDETAAEGAGWFSTPDEDTRRWLAAVKSLVIAADIAGSALPAEGESPEEWIRERLNKTLTREILDRIVSELLGKASNAERDDFQRRVADSTDMVTYVRAGCGAGKTIAAYKWAAKRAVGRKLFFCYPTTGTASQGFKDYVTKSKTEGELIHSRAIVDSVDLAETPPDSGEEQEVTDKRLEQLLKFESFQSWSAKLVVCTVDTVLGLMQNNRRGLFSFPALARAAFIFDEIHSYDAKLFGALCRFLKTFRGAPILLMTASLPPHMLKRLDKTLGVKLKEISGPKTREGAQRYRLNFVKSNPEEEAWNAVTTQLEISKKGKVLWIANTVDRAVQLYCRAKRECRLRVFLYHGRFRYFERREKHDAVIRSFDRELDTESVLVIATQVAEMSLDLSADLLVTDIAPPASLIQRFGRLNRDEDNPNKTGLALILDRLETEAWPYVTPNGGKPSDEFLLAYKWIESLPQNSAELSQADLAKSFQDVLGEYGGERFTSASTWLGDDGNGWHSRIDSLREGELSVPIVLERDIEFIRAKGDGLSNELTGRERRRQARFNIRQEAILRSTSIPVGRQRRKQVFEWDRLPEHKLFLIARDTDVAYSSETGVEWRS